MRVTRRDVNGKIFTTVVISRLDTRGKILSIEDNCDFSLLREGHHYENVRLNCTSYGEGQVTVNMQHYVDLDDMLLLAHDVVHCMPVEYSEYKGGPNSKYSTGYESRIFGVKFDQRLNHDKGGYQIILKASAGTQADSKVIIPAKSATDAVKEIRIIIPTIQLRTAMLSVTRYYNAVLAGILARDGGSLHASPIE